MLVFPSPLDILRFQVQITCIAQDTCMTHRDRAGNLERNATCSKLCYYIAMLQQNILQCSYMLSCGIMFIKLHW